MTEESSKLIPQSIYDKVAELEGIVSEIEAAQEIKESQFPSATIGSHALTEEGLTFIEKVRQSGYRPTYNPDDKLNLEAMLPCAFARSVKMMRFINEVYDGDKEHFYLAGQKSSRKNSRFISANRIEIRPKGYTWPAWKMKNWAGSCWNRPSVPLAGWLTLSRTMGSIQYPMG